MRHPADSPPLLLAILLIACAGCASAPPAPMPVPAKLVTGFEPAVNGFAFANGLVWRYDTGDAETERAGKTGVDGAAEDDITHRCVLMARAARQFYYAARFDASLPPLSPQEYASRVDRVLATDARRERAIEDPIVFPGFADLHAFSAAYDDLLKQHTRSAWSTYMQRGNWRMIFAFGPGHQRATAEALLANLARGHPPIVHALNFPHVDVNHTLLVHAAEADARQIRFGTYDPNQPDISVELRYDRELARFSLPRTPYYAGGTVKVYEIYDGPLY